MMNNANMRKCRPCLAFPALFEVGAKEQSLQNLALSLHPVLPLQLPVKIERFDHAETSSLFLHLLLRK